MLITNGEHFQPGDLVEIWSAWDVVNGGGGCVGVVVEPPEEGCSSAPSQLYYKVLMSGQLMWIKDGWMKHVQRIL